MTGSILIFSVLLSAISDCAYALAVGVMLASSWLDAGKMLPARSVFSRAHARKWLIVLGILMAVVQTMRLWFLAAGMSGANLFRENLALIPSVLSSTHQGLLWKVNMAAVLAFLASSAAIGRRNNRVTHLLGLICLCAIAFTKAASGHAADNGDFTRQEMLQWVHIFSTAAWAGGVIVSGLIVLPPLVRTAASEMVWQYLRRLSKVATYAVLAVFVSGLYAADRELSGMFSGTVDRYMGTNTDRESGHRIICGRSGRGKPVLMSQRSWVHGEDHSVRPSALGRGDCASRRALSLGLAWEHGSCNGYVVIPDTMIETKTTWISDSRQSFAMLSRNTLITSSTRSEFDPCLECNHARRAISSETHAKQAGWRRDGAFERAELRRYVDSRHPRFDRAR